MRRLLSLLFTPFLVLAGFAEAATPSIPPAATVVLKDSGGKMFTPLARNGQTATVFVFLMHDCPVTNASAPELARLAGEFAPRGVHFFGVYVTETEKEISTHRDEYGLSFPGLLDPGLQLARVAGATRAPEAAVFSPDGTLLYRGRIDDRATKPGTIRPKPSRHDLRLAIESVLAGRLPEPRFTTSIGCYLPTE